MKYKFSRFLHLYSKEDKLCCYNSLTMKTVYTTKQKFETLKELILNNTFVEGNPLFKELFENSLVIEQSFDEDILLEQLRNEIFDGVSIRVMVLHLTDFCNLKCKYCFIEGGQPENYQRKKMESATMTAAVDKFIKIIKRNNNEKNHPSVVFYGGEPLLNWSILEEALNYIHTKEQEEQITLDKVIITNGILIKPEIADVLKEHNVMVSVSLDGIESVHNFNRIDHHNNGTFDRVVSGIRILQNSGLEPTVSCVMAKESVNSCEESVRYLIEEIGVTGLGFNHVSIIPGLNYYDEEYEENFADAIIKVQEIIQNEYSHIYERRMGHKVNTFIDKKLIKSDCTGCGEQISVSPDGEIGICQGYMGTRKTFRHTVFEEDYFPDEDAIFKEWSNRSPLNIEKCLNCPALATCGGGCPRNADMLHGSIWETDSAFCHFALKAQEWLVWQKIEEE